MGISRRQFLFGTLAASSAASLGLYTNSTWQIAKRYNDFTIHELPLEFNDYRVGFISDIHLGTYVSEEWMAHALSLLKPEKLDLLLIGGDHINVPNGGHVPSKLKSPAAKEKLAAEKLFNQFVHILNPKDFADGIIGIAGNHDNWYAKGIVKDTFERAGIHYLINEIHTIRRDNAQLEIVGVDDYWTGVPVLPQSPTKRKTARILLAHNPDFISKTLSTTNYHFSLALAGHTHGGQICLPGGAALVSNIADSRFIKGVYEKERSPVLVSCGVGVVEIPLRFSCPAEVHVITLKSSTTRPRRTIA